MHHLLPVLTPKVHALPHPCQRRKSLTTPATTPGSLVHLPGRRTRRACPGRAGRRCHVPPGIWQWCTAARQRGNTRSWSWRSAMKVISSWAPAARPDQPAPIRARAPSRRAAPAGSTPPDRPGGGLEPALKSCRMWFAAHGPVAPGQPPAGTTLKCELRGHDALAGRAHPPLNALCRRCWWPHRRTASITGRALRPWSLSEYSTRRYLGIDMPVDQAGGLKLAQGAGQHLMGHIRDEPLEVAEPACAVGEPVEHDQIPPAAQDSQGGR